MPAIKKKWIEANQGEVKTPNTSERVISRAASSTLHEDEDKDREMDGDVTSPSKVSSPTKPKAKKRPIDSPNQGGMLRGLDAEVLLSKRKRFIPPAESKLDEWLANNFEKKDDVKLSLTRLYKFYTGVCQEAFSDIVDVPAFNRAIKIKFGKTFGLKEGSVYKTLLKEKKLQEPKKANSGLKLKDIIHEAINHFGNPYNGVRFVSLKQFVATKYPFLQIDQRPKTLKRYVEMGVGYGQIEVVKGIGMAGFYRLPGAKPPPPKVEPGKESGAVADKTKAEDADSAGSDAQEPKEKAGTDREEKPGGNAGTDEKAKKPKAAQPPKKCNLMRVPHGKPRKIEHTFPLAITFQSAPKTASIIRIRRYIESNYKETVPDNRWRKAIEGGVEKHHWEYFSGSGITGRLHLLMDDFDPDSEHLEDMICAGIIACHEPKSASGNQIRKYVSRYHPDFNVDAKPHRFKMAVLRAVNSRMIQQVSGLGMNGSFELADTFVPSPKVLSGENAASSEENSDSSDEEPAYIAKGTKSRGVPKKKSSVAVSKGKSSSSVAKKKSLARKVSTVKGRGRPSKKSKEAVSSKKASPKKGSKKLKPPPSDISSDEEEEQQEYTPRKSKSRGGASSKTPTPQKSASKKKRMKQSPKPKSPPQTSSKADDSDLDEEDLIVEYTPRKSQSRGGGPSQRSPAAAPQRSSVKQAASASKAGKVDRSKARPESAPLSESPRLVPKISLSLGRLKNSAASEDEASDAEEAEPEYRPRKSTSRGGSPDKKPVAEKKKGKKGRKRF